MLNWYYLYWIISLSCSYSIGDGIINENTIAIFIGHICKNGQLCGVVKKYGRRLRDPICDKICPKSLRNGALPAYIGYHHPITGYPIGPTFHTLIGGSILYSPDKNYPGNNNAYIYKSSTFAIKGSFDQHGLLIKGQKVPYLMKGCDENGLAKLEFKEPKEPKTFYHYKPPNEKEFGDQPLVSDELAVEYFKVKSINKKLVNNLNSILDSVFSIFKHKIRTSLTKGGF